MSVYLTKETLSLPSWVNSLHDANGYVWRLFTCNFRIMIMNNKYYNVLLDLNVLYNSFQKCKKGVDWKNSVQKYEANLLFNLNDLRKRLENETYKPDKFVEFDVSERGKTRHIKSPSIRDKVLQHALCDYVLEPIIYPKLIYNNGASIKGKGVEFSRKQLTKHLMKYYKEFGNEGYILVCDFKKFFDSIPHDKLIEALSKRISDSKIMELLKKIIYSFSDTGKGLGIGSQISQICGVYYPTQIDTFCTVVKGCKYYARHMDDFYVIHKDKEFLKSLLVEIRIIAEKLGLTLNEKKTQICKLCKGFVFLKQFIFLTGTGKIVRRPCKTNITRERRKLKSFKKKLTCGKMTLSYIEEHYKSWRGATKKYAKSYTIKNMDELFKRLFYDDCNRKMKK